MAVRILFNELSCSPSATSDDEASRRVIQFLDVIRAALRHGADRTVYACSAIFVMEICQGYQVSECGRLKGLSEEHRDFFRDLMSVSKYIDEESASLNLECANGGQKGQGLTVAYAEDGLAVSFMSSPVWDTDYLHVRTTEENEAADDFVESDGLVRHASRVSHVDSHQQWISSRRSMARHSKDAAKLSIETEIEIQKKNFGVSSVPKFDFGEDFASSAAKCGFYDGSGTALTHLLAETCARVLCDRPKYDLNVFYCGSLEDGWTAMRTHLTKRSSGYRLMYWVRKDGFIVFANVGEKQEEVISYDISRDALDGG